MNHEPLSSQTNPSLYDGHKTPKKECRKQCRETIILALGTFLPNPLPVAKVFELYNRFYDHKRRYTHQLSFLRFLERMEIERLIHIEYNPTDVPHAVYLRHTRFSTALLDLPACLLPVRNCYDRGCAHRSDCEVHFDRRTDIALQPN